MLLIQRWFSYKNFNIISQLSLQDRISWRRSYLHSQEMLPNCTCPDTEARHWGYAIQDFVLFVATSRAKEFPRTPFMITAQI